MKKIKNLSLIIIISLILTGCSGYLAERDRKREENRRLAYEQQMRIDRSTCTRYGFTPNTPSFSNCLMEIDMKRKAELRRQKAIRCAEARRQNRENPAPGIWGGILMGANENMACK